jgi:hypothetical protein
LQATTLALGLQVALDRVANVRGDVLEVRQAFVVTRDAVAVILDREVVRATLAGRALTTDPARAPMLFSTNSGDELERGSLCESAMIRSHSVDADLSLPCRGLLLRVQASSQGPARLSVDEGWASVARGECVPGDDRIDVRTTQ